MDINNLQRTPSYSYRVDVDRIKQRLQQADKNSVSNQFYALMNERKRGCAFRRLSRRCGNVYNWLAYCVVGNTVCRTWESRTLAFPCAVNGVIHDAIACLS